MSVNKFLNTFMPNVTILTSIMLQSQVIQFTSAMHITLRFKNICFSFQAQEKKKCKIPAATINCESQFTGPASKFEASSSGTETKTHILKLS